MKIDKTSLGVPQLEYAKTLQDYQLLWSSIITYWIALAVGLIIAYSTEKLVLNVFFIGVISVSAFITLSIFFKIANLQDRLEEIRKGLQ